MIPHRHALVPAAFAFCFAALVGACGGGGGTKTATPAGSPAATTVRTPAATAASALGIREVDLSKVADVASLVTGTGGQFVQSDVVYADLTGDGIDDAVVPISSGGTRGDVAFIVLTPSGSATNTLLKQVPLGQGGLSVAIEGGQLVMTEALYGPNDPNCCPSALRRTTYVWNGTSLAVQSVKTDANPAGGGKITPQATP